MVTGGSGFIGRHIVARLVEGGRQVLTYDRDPVPPQDGLITVHGELHDIPRMIRTIEEHGVREIIHTAGISDPDVSLEMPVTTFFANVMGTVNLLEAARLTGIEKVVNFSSSSVFGHQPEGVREDVKLEPVTPYGVSKLAAEKLGKVYSEIYDLDVTALRVTWVYGPGNKMPETVNQLIRAALDGKPYVRDEGADHPMPMVYVDDVASATWCALNSVRPPLPAYTITGPDRLDLGGLAEAVQAQLPDGDIRIGNGDLHLHRLGPIDTSATEADLGFRPDWGIERGIRTYVAWLQKNPF